MAWLTFVNLTAIAMNLLFVSFSDSIQLIRFKESKPPKISNYESKPRLQIYYETLCPHSRNFIVHEFIPTMLKLGKFVNYELIPYGHTEMQQRISTTPTQNLIDFQCQHGPTECDGNMIHACAIAKGRKLVKQNQPIEYNFEHNFLGFIGCTMLNSFPDSSEFRVRSKFDLNPGKVGKKYAEDFGLDWNVIYSCWKSQEGIDLLQVAGWKTERIDPPLRIVPWIVFNDSQDEQEEIKNDLLRFLCKYIPSESVGDCTG